MRLTLGLLFFLLPLSAADFTATFLHVNDTHARVEPTIIQGKPYGGMTRLGTLIERYRQSDPNPIVLHAGDAFQGTFYFNAYDGLADLAFLNAIHLDAMTVGNHEFDKGPAALGAFARNAQFPLVSANLDVDSEPALAGRVQRSVILTRNGEHIGIVGGITDDALNISSPGPNVRLREQHSGLQTEIDGLTRQGVNKIVLLTHIGYQPELELARTLHNVDVIVGGHSHTLLGTTTAPGFPSSQGPYPTIVDNPDQGKTIVVQSWEGEKVLGRIQVTFDEQGRVTRWSSTQPVLVDETVPEQPALRALLAAFEKPIAQQRDRKVAEAAEPLAQSALGAIIADAMLAATANRKSVAAFIQGGGVRAALEPGAITYGAALAVQPFNDTLVVMDLTGAQILQALEDNSSNAGRILWTSAGTGYTLDASKPAGARISDLRIAGKPVDPVAAYRVVVQDYLANGGDNAITLKNSSGFREDTRLLDIDIFLDYLAAHSPVRTPAEVRVTRK